MKVCDVRPGDNFGSLTVLMTGRVGGGESVSVCACDCGKVKKVRTHNLVTVRSCGCSRKLPRRSSKETIKYHSVHKLLRTTRGPASDHSCVDCGSQAEEWSYDGGSPTERVQSVSDGRTGKHRDVAHSGRDVAFYSPRCKRCHHKMDLARSRSNLS